MLSPDTRTPQRCCAPCVSDSNFLGFLTGFATVCVFNHCSLGELVCDLYVEGLVMVTCTSNVYVILRFTSQNYFKMYALCTLFQWFVPSRGRVHPTLSILLSRASWVVCHLGLWGAVLLLPMSPGTCGLYLGVDLPGQRAGHLLHIIG